MLQGILIIVVFLVIAALMMTKKIPTLLALPLMAVIICIIAGVPAVGTDAEGNAIGWLQTVVENGTVRMGSAIMAVIFGAWLGQLMNKTGVTENIIKKSAELGGGRYPHHGGGRGDPVHHAERPGLYHYGWLHRAAYSGVGRRSGYQRSVHFPNGIHHGPHV